jgi:L-fuculose-phosphate aldolase
MNSSATNVYEDSAETREEICEVGRRMYARNLVAATDGNISVRLRDGNFLGTPSAVSKGFMAPGDLIVCDADGNKVSGSGKVTSEIFTHLAAYEERPDANAVVHAHPPNAVACTLAGISLAEPLLPELIGALGGIPTADYAMPGSREGSEVIRNLIRECDAVMLDRHGSVTVGLNLRDALYCVEKLEHAAETIIAAYSLGKPVRLPEEEIEKLYRFGADYGATGKRYRRK